jgi:hypothetical protein
MGLGIVGGSLKNQEAETTALGGSPYGCFVVSLQTASPCRLPT